MEVNVKNIYFKLLKNNNIFNKGHEYLFSFSQCTY